MLRRKSEFQSSDDTEEPVSDRNSHSRTLNHHLTNTSRSFDAPFRCNELHVNTVKTQSIVIESAPELRPISYFTATFLVCGRGPSMEEQSRTEPRPRLQLVSHFYTPNRQSLGIPVLLHPRHCLHPSYLPGPNGVTLLGNGTQTCNIRLQNTINSSAKIIFCRKKVTMFRSVERHGLAVYA